MQHIMQTIYTCNLIQPHLYTLTVISSCTLPVQRQICGFDPRIRAAFSSLGHPCGGDGAHIGMQPANTSIFYRTSGCLAWWAILISWDGSTLRQKSAFKSSYIDLHFHIPWRERPLGLTQIYIFLCVRIQLHIT